LIKPNDNHKIVILNSEYNSQG